MELNDTVRVFLTKEGAEILNNISKKYNEAFPNLQTKFKEDYIEHEVYCAQLWSLFEYFGTYCSAGSAILFTDLQKVNN